MGNKVFQVTFYVFPGDIDVLWECRGEGGMWECEGVKMVRGRKGSEEGHVEGVRTVKERKGM